MSEEGSVPTRNQIVQTVDSLQDEAIQMLQDLVSYASTLGNEKGVQDYMYKFFTQTLKLETKRFGLNKDELEKLKGWSPADWSYDGRECIIATHKSKVQKNDPKKDIHVFLCFVFVLFLMLFFIRQILAAL